MPGGGGKQRGWGSHMLSGVPFELRWKPRQLPSLPDSPPPVQPQLLDNWTGRDYDFALEHRVLFPPESERQEAIILQRQQENAKADKPKHSEGNATKATVDHSQAAKKNGYAPPVRNSIATFQLSKDPLKPQPVAPAPAAPGVRSPAITAPLNVTSLKDFDRVEDPFDDAELRTIDDMAELKNVLNGVSGQSCVLDSSDDSSSSGKQSNHRSPVQSVHEITFPKLSLALDSPTSSALSMATTTRDAANAPSTLPFYMPPSSMMPPQLSTLPTQQPTTQPQIPQLSTSMSTPLSSIPTLSNPQPLPPRLLQPLPPPLPLLLPPQIPAALNQQIGSLTTAGIRSSSYPELSSVSSTSLQPSARLQQQQQRQEQASKSLAQAPPTAPRLSASKLAGPDPYPELSVLERVKADSLCAMGFPRDRAARAVARLGMSDAELFAYLCSVDRVSDACAVAPIEAENAIRMLGSEAKAIRYLRLHAEMLDFGFSSDDIAAAAVASDLDRDKTVALLLKRNGLSLK